MKMLEHIGQTLRYTTVFPDDYRAELEYPIVVFLHGFGSDMRDLIPLAEEIGQGGYVYVCPNGPVEVPIGPGQTGYGWIPLPGLKRNPAQLNRSIKGIHEVVDEVIGGNIRVRRRVMLVGFSQGGEMAYRYGLSYPGIVVGLATLCSTSPPPEDLLHMMSDLPNQPIFIAQGVNDPMIGPEDARETRQLLESRRYEIFHKDYVMGHEIIPQVLDDLVPWIHQVLPPIH